MAQYRATIQGMRGEASRLGNKASGIYVTIDGWEIGMNAYTTHIHGEDVLTISFTGGSNGGHVRTIGTYKVINGKPQSCGV